MRSDDLIADRYRLVSLIGAGRMGVVWLAEDLREHRQVALKRPHAGGADLARRVAHPNIVEVYDVVSDGDECWLVMEYFPSESLATLGTLPPTQVAAIGSQVAGALAAAHANDVIHRDVTSGNVLVADDGTAKITDFSACRAATVTSVGRISGTAAYVAPEVADGAEATAPSDVFSLGATLFNAVEGKPPFGTGDPDAVLARIRAGRSSPATKAGPMAPVLAALLHRDRAGRPTAEQAKELLDEVLAGRPVPPWAPARRNKKPLLVGLAVATVLALVVVLWRPWEPGAGDPTRTVLGDPRGADPCAFADPEALSEFGPATVDPHHATFNRCDVLIELPQDRTIDVLFEFAAPGKDGPLGNVVRNPPERDAHSCEVTVRLADKSTLDVAARTDDQVETDLCAVATVATDHVMDVLQDNEQVPRRPAPAPATSLAHVDACSLITAADLARVPTFADAAADPEFANWECRWRAPNGTAALRVIFARGPSNTIRTGKRTSMDNRDAYTQEEGHGPKTCGTTLLNHDYFDDRGTQRSEAALVVIQGDLPMTDMCTLANTFAEPVASRLPRR